MLFWIAALAAACGSMPAPSKAGPKPVSDISIGSCWFWRSVTTSARLANRVPAGFGSYLAGLHSLPDDPEELDNVLC